MKIKPLFQLREMISKTRFTDEKKLMIFFFSNV